MFAQFKLLSSFSMFQVRPYVFVDVYVFVFLFVFLVDNTDDELRLVLTNLVMIFSHDNFHIRLHETVPLFPT